MKRLILSIATVATLVLAGCATPTLKPEITPGTDFSRYHTFAVLPPGDAKTGEPITGKSPLATAAVNSATQILVSKGLKTAGEAEADLLVKITGSATYAPGYDYRQPIMTRNGTLDVFYSMNSFAFPQTQTYFKLTVELKDRAAQKVVWRATHSETLLSQPSEKTVEIATKRILESYPAVSGN